MTATTQALDELADLLQNASTVTGIFGDELLKQYRRLAKICHPDCFPVGPQQERAKKLFVQLTAWYERTTAGAAPKTVRSPQREYSLIEEPITGDLADVSLATADAQ